MLAAGHGDCLWIEYGTEADRHHMLIDAGTPGAWKRLKSEIKTRFGKQPPHFDLFVITHIDADHIGGAVKLLADHGVTFGDIWFNGWEHLHGGNPNLQLGSKQGEAVAQMIVDRALPWNKAFFGKAVAIRRWPAKKTLPGGFALTLLSPYPRQLTALIPDWEKELRKAGLWKNGKPLRPRRSASSLALGGDDECLDIDSLLKEKFQSDTAAANGSSIAFLAEYSARDKKPVRALFTGDAHVPVLLESLKRLQANGSIAVDLLKLAHHGAGGNTSTELLKRLTCPRYLVSSNGAYFEHPERSAIARILVHAVHKTKHLIFNYSTRFNRIWNDSGLKSKYNYETSYPSDDTGGATLDL
jgi:beta-lactamase superfamily II metal-dependent hydrolase